MKQTSSMLAAVAIAASLALAACGSDDDPSSRTAEAPAESAPSSGSSAGTAGDVNAADVEFAQRMIAHHEQAIQMAEIALDPAVAAGPEVIDLAERIKDAQEPEIERMTEWLTAWGQPGATAATGGHGMDGMMSSDAMDDVAALSGPEFDRTWMEMMIAHHEGAIAMAREVQANGSDPDVLDLAATIIAAQQGEVDEMRAVLGG